MLCDILYLLPHLLIFIRCYYMLTALRTIADNTEFHSDFSFVVYIDRWQPWHAKLKKTMLFFFFSIFAFMCVHSQPTKIMFVDAKYKNGKQIL